MELNKGYWRSMVTSTVINECLLSDACPGGNATTCSEGYTGVLCHTCIGNDGQGSFWARSRKHACNKCESTSVLSIKTIGLFMFLFAYLGVMTWLLISHAAREKDHSVLLRILTNYFQIVLLVKSMDISWPDSIKQTLEALTFAS